jgi:xanthine dehydrogenase YagT iron-sulfur-binding subunit
MELPADCEPDRLEGSSRREFIRRLAAVSAGLTVAAPLGRGAAVTQESLPKSPPTTADGPQGWTEINLTVNGNSERLVVDPRVTLLDALRDRLELTGTKKGCDRGACGAFTVILMEASFIVFGSICNGSGEGDHDHRRQRKGSNCTPVQAAAFMACDGFQCGYCTPGHMMSAVACINEGHTSSDLEIRGFMSGNLCRCGAYPNIVDAIKVAAAKMKGGVN